MAEEETQKPEEQKEAAPKTEVTAASSQHIEITKDTTAVDTDITLKEKAKVDEKIKQMAMKLASKAQEAPKPVLIKETPEDFSSEEVEFTKVTDEQVEEALKVTEKYTAKDIKVLEGLEPVRERPGMYIGSTGPYGLNLLVREIVDNSVDEALAGYAKHIKVTLLPGDETNPVNMARIEDDGRGVPVDIVPGKDKSALETIYTDLHAGGKFEGGTGYKVSGGLHGVGAKVVNALSTEMLVQSKRDGKVYQISFRNGGKKVEDVHVVGDVPDGSTGTLVQFRPDPTIFKQTTSFDFDTIADRLRQTAYLNKGLELTLLDLRDPQEVKKKVFKYDGGIIEYVKAMNEGRGPLFDTVMYFEGMSKPDHVFIEAAMQPNSSQVFNMRSFVNNIFTSEGGTHEEGFRLAIGRELNNYYRAKGWLKEKDESFSYDDLNSGLTVVLSVKHDDPEFEGQTKGKLGNVEVRKDVSSIVGDSLKEWLYEHPNEGRIMFEKHLKNYRSRKRAELEKNKVLKGSFSSSLSDKLAECVSKDPKERELFIVEGNSAGGSAKKGRDAKTQAILPLRGKILNVEKAHIERIEKNAEIMNMIQCIGAGIGENFDVSKIRYDKVIIMTDADVDGSHIQILLLTFFYRFMRPLIETGHVYIAMPPLYKLTYQGHEYYCFREEELPELKSHLPAGAKYSLNRYKGLGEMNPSELAETTMVKGRRWLKQVTIDDALAAANAITDLMGEAVPPRKEFITANARFVQNLDI